MARQAKSDKHDAIEMLKEDHKRVQKIFKDFEKEKQSEKRQDLVDLACTELMVHARLEEELFYPEVRAALKDEEMMDEAEVEHTVAEELIDKLVQMGPEDEKLEATFTVLGEYVNHHIEEEEKEMFPKCKKAKLDLDDLGARMQTRQEELMQEMGANLLDVRSGKRHGMGQHQRSA